MIEYNWDTIHLLKHNILLVVLYFEPDISLNFSVFISGTSYCHLKPEPGLCRAFIPMWHYDPETSTCKIFIYGGCAGNKNKFKSQEECLSTCARWKGTLEIWK